MHTPPSPARLIVLYHSNELNRQRAKVAESNVERRREWQLEHAGVRARRNDLTRLQTFVARREKIREPYQRTQRMTIAVTALVSQYRFRPAGNSDPDRFQRPNRTVVHFRSYEQSLVVESVGKHFEKGGARRIRVATACELQHESRLANRGAHV